MWRNAGRSLRMGYGDFSATAGALGGRPVAPVNALLENTLVLSEAFFE